MGVRVPLHRGTPGPSSLSVEEGLCTQMLQVWNNVLPYHTKVNDFQLSLALDAKELPGSQLDMPDTVWTFVQECCNFEATQRPTALLMAAHFCLHLVLQRVSRWVRSVASVLRCLNSTKVSLSRPLDAHGRDLWQRTEAYLRASTSTDLYVLTDSGK